MKLVVDEMSDPLCGTEAISDQSKHKKQVTANATHTQGALGVCGHRRGNGMPGNMDADVAATPKKSQTLHAGAGRPMHGMGSSNVCKMCSLFITLLDVPILNV